MPSSIVWTVSPFKYTWCNACDCIVDKVELNTGNCADCLTAVTA